MPVLGITTPTSQPPLQQISPTSSQHKHNGNSTPSLSDVDGLQQSIGPPANSTGRIGSILDIRV
ncbi:MAG: hypothetical protein WBD71_09770 [Xanthobacteraceae bacterium]